jgi:hypothetical protein
VIYADSWTNDGSASAISYQQGIWLFARDGKTEPRQLLQTATKAEISPDGRWLAYNRTVPRSQPDNRVYVQPYPALAHREQISPHNGASPAWRRDGRELYYVQNVSADGPLEVRVMAVPITTTPMFSAGTPHLLFEGPFRIDGPFRGYDVTADGRRTETARAHKMTLQSDARLGR